MRSIIRALPTGNLTEVGKIAPSYDSQSIGPLSLRVYKGRHSSLNQSTDPLSLRERAGVRVKCLNTHQPPIGTSLVATLPNPYQLPLGEGWGEGLRRQSTTLSAIPSNN